MAHKAERYGLDFAHSMIKLHGFGGNTEFWDHDLGSYRPMAGLAAVTTRIIGGGYEETDLFTGSFQKVKVLPDDCLLTMIRD